MTIDPKRVKEIFLEAAELSDEARTAYLDRACGGDAGLRARVEALLRSHDPEGSFLGTPAAVMPDPDPAVTQDLTGNSDPGSEAAQSATGENGPSDDEPLSFLAPPTRPDSLGRIGHYEVLQVLGRGGFGIAFRAFDEMLQRVVALKVMAPQLATTSPARKRFLREARSSAQVRHENVVQVYEVAEQPLPYLAMEFIPGETLQQKLNRVGPLDVPEVLRIGRQIAEGLAAAHATDLIHRDIKPGNVLLEGGQHKVKITDFGLARAADDASISQSGVIAGTPMYMAPEQAQGQTLDQRADLFSLGSVLYQMVTGRPPFRANTTVAVLKRVAEDKPRDIREIIPETPQWLCDIIAKLHAKEPDDRYQSAREVADVLADCEAQLKANSKLKDYSRIPRSEPRRSGRRKWVAVVAAVLLPVLALAVTEFAGVTHLFRGQQGTSAPNKSGSDPEAEAPPPAIAPFDAAQARAHQEAWAKHLGVPVESTNSIGMKMRLIPPGEFTMGSPAEEIEYALQLSPNWVKESVKSEGPAQRVRVERPFALGIHEVTVGQFRRFVDATGYLTECEKDGQGGWKHSREQNKMVQHKDFIWRNPTFCESDDHPVVFVTLKDAQAFCDWLSRTEARQYVVPTETQWEYACRAGTQTVWYWGKDGTEGLEHGWSIERSNDKAHRVGSKSANPFGLYDMAGNVYEIGLDNQNRPASRGGSFSQPWVMLRSAARIPNDIRYPAASDRGFRVAIVGDQKPPAVAPFTDADVKRIAALPAEQQVEEVRKELMRRNPGFDGKVGHKIEDGVVTGIRVPTDYVTDISPLRVFNSLRVLDCGGADAHSRPGSAQLADLTPLKGMNLTGLTHLTFTWTNVDDSGLALFKDCENLTDLYLGGTRLSDAGLAQFRNCKSLHTLYLHHTRVGDAGLVHFKDCDNLRCLQLDGTRVSDAGLAYFKDCKNLRSLQLWGTQVSDAGLANFEHSKELQVLTLKCERMSDLGLANFKNCKKLTNLALGGRQVNDTGLANFKDCKNLQALVFQGTQVSDRGLAYFKDCKDLTLLEITDTKVSDLSLMKRWPLKELKCDFHRRDAEILRSLKTLEKINGKPVAEFWKDVQAGKYGFAPLSDADVQRIAALPATQQIAEVRKELMKRNPQFDGLLRSTNGFAPEIENGAVVNLWFRTDNVRDISPVRALTGLRFLHICATERGRGKLSDLSPLKELSLVHLWVAENPNLRDLSPLQGMHLSTLHLGGTGVKSIEVVKEMPIQQLWIDDTPVADLSPLAGKSLSFLNILHAAKNVKEMKGSEVNRLLCEADQIPDDGDLERLGVKNLEVWGRATTINRERLRALGPRLTQINGNAAAEFWKELDRGKTAVAPFTDADVKRIAALPTAEQIEEVRKEFKKRNPGFDGKVTHKIEGDVVTGLYFVPVKGQDAVIDLSPVRALPGLTSLLLVDCYGLGDLAPLKGLSLTRLEIGGGGGDVQVRDLEPLRGMRLTRLALLGSRVQDLEPLKGMPLISLNLHYGRQVRNLEPLKGMPLLTLDIDGCDQIEDFSPLKGMPLTRLWLGGTKVRDLEPLKGMKLTFLNLIYTRVRDLEPLKGMPLKSLLIFDTGVTDLSPLEGMPLEDIRLTPKNITQGLDILRNIKSLETIGIGRNQAWPAAEFWQRYDKGEFK